jgi:hypothetical protein
MAQEDFINIKSYVKINIRSEEIIFVHQTHFLGK